TPPAMVGREATPPRLGPIVPLAPGIPGMVWHAPQPFCWISCTPTAGSPPPGAGCGGLAGTGPPGAGAGETAGSTDGCTPGATAGAGTTGDGDAAGDAAGLGTGAGGGALPDCCCCSQVWKSPGGCVVTRNSMPLWPAPHSMAHTPRNSPARLAVKVM